MRPLHILFANEPRAYREALAAALGHLAEFRVGVTTPGELAATLDDDQPDVVVCSELTSAVERRDRWVLLYPEGRNELIVGTEGERTVVETVDLDCLLAGLLAAVGRRPPDAP